EVAVPLLVEKDVGRFEVAVDDALPVGVSERSPDLGEQARGWLEVPPSALELRHELSLGFEATDEPRLVDQFGPDDLDGDFPPDRRLVGAVYDAEVAAAGLLAQLVAADRPVEGAERGAG